MMKFEDLKPDPDNPRSITDGALEALSSSLEEFGDISGIVYNEKTGELVAGHQRLKAVKEKGKPTLTSAKRYKWKGEDERLLTFRDASGAMYTVRSVKWDKDRQMAANLAANSRYLAGDFTREAMALLEEVEATHPDLHEALRFDELFADLEKEFVDEELPPAEGNTDPDDLPEPGGSRAQVGDIWELGAHRVLCGSAADFDALEGFLRGSAVRMIWTDPPYGVAYADKNEFLNAAGKGNSNQEEIKGDHMSPEAVQGLLTSALQGAGENVVVGASFYIAAPPGDMLPYFLEAIELSSFVYKHGLVWVKNNFVLGRCDYHYQHEMVLYGWAEGAHYFVNDHTKTTVFEFDKPRDSDSHPTMKPVGLIVEHIQNSSRRGETVYDPFLGSGSTLIAAEQTGRVCFGVEIDPKNVDIILQRWEDFTGKRARKI